MKETDLPSPNLGEKGYHLRRITAQSISQLQITAQAYGGTHPNAANLVAFFEAAKAALQPYVAS